MWRLETIDMSAHRIKRKRVAHPARLRLFASGALIAASSKYRRIALARPGINLAEK